MSGITMNATFVIKKNSQQIILPDLRLDAGDFAIIKGPNGSGKSTLLKAFLGNNDYFTVKTGSSLRVQHPLLADLKSDNVFEMKDADSSLFRSLIAYMGQEESDSFRTVNEQLRLPTENALATLEDHHLLTKAQREEKETLLYQIIKNFRHRYLDDILKSTDVSFFHNPYVNRAKGLSGGQKKMVSFTSYIIKSMVIGSLLFVLDEPLNNLDRENKMRVNNLLADLREKNPDIIILIITHCSIFYGINKTILLKKNGENCFTAATTAVPETPYQCLQPKEEVENDRYSSFG
ncbi:MAG: ATP-binding cassette domain-containing protein [Bacilli bacterium]|jgi:ABC-type Mn2+/Zn2+ transport system ATPase subunit|nr:ATP-binding cassette domain-containing protein [Bacilli bacterium]